MSADGLRVPQVSLSTLAALQTEKVVGRKNPEFPYVGLEHLAPDTPLIVGFASARSSVSTNGVFRPGDILFGKLRPNLRKSAAAHTDGYCSTDILVLRTRDGFSPSFVAHALRGESVFRRAVATAIGTKMPRTSWAALRDLEVFAPQGIEEQSSIANALDSIDVAIRASEQVVAKLETLRRGLLDDLLACGIDDNGDIRDPVGRPEQFKDSPIGRIPTLWRVLGIDHFAGPERAVIKTGPFGSSLKGEHWVPKGVPVITIGALGEGEFIRSELLYVSSRKAQSLASYVVRTGDVVFSRVADVGRSVVVTALEDGWIMSSNLMWISVDPARAVPAFLWLNLSANAVVRSQIRRSVNAGGREVANGAVLRSLLFPWPNRDEQQEIVNRDQHVRERLAGEAATLIKLRLIRKGLSDDLLTGRVRVATAREDTE